MCIEGEEPGSQCVRAMTRRTIFERKIARLRKFTFANLVAILFASGSVSLDAGAYPPRSEAVTNCESTHLEMDRVLLNDPLGIEMPSMDQSDDEDPYWRHEDDGTTTLSISVGGIADNRGKIILLAYDDEKAFSAGDTSAAVGYAEADAKTGSITIQMAVYGLGLYAIVALHDANSDNELNMKNGRPSEGYGVSGGLDPYSPVQNFTRAATVRGEARVRIVYHSNPYR
jgi:uncharacterized protein (DUF2141 family)